MKKRSLLDVVIIAVLFTLMMAWGPLYQKFFAPPPPPAVEPQLEYSGAPEGMASPMVAAPAAAERAEEPGVDEGKTGATIPPPEISEAAPRRSRATVTLSNETVRVRFESLGAAISSVELPQYRALNDPNSPPVTLDFRSHPALSYAGWPALAEDMDLRLQPDGQGLLFSLVGEGGLRFTRSVILTNRYQLLVEDVFVNAGEAPLLLPAHSLCTGPMRIPEGEHPVKSAQFLSLDTLPSAGGERVRNWNRKGVLSSDAVLTDFFQEPERRGRGCGAPRMTRPMPAAAKERVRVDTDWVAAKNKFFVQILAPEGGAHEVDLLVRRVVSERENPADSRTWAASPVLEEVAAQMWFEERRLAPGESLRRKVSYYVGPKEYDSVKRLGNHQEEVMEFGRLKPLCHLLLKTLNGAYRLIPNYGVAIILVTFLIRIVFWPVTHKSTESMKKMQELQPKLQELRARYKDKPQKLQQETMALYKAHKVNPFGGCLPMIVQIPVFIALFNVLRSAVELRYASFLWIRDLSEAENLLAGILPIPLNILPLIMSATMAWQQKLTPSGGDPSQQRMMMLMPLMMLFFFYTMPSALVLYWTVNQVMMITQLLWQRWRKKPAIGVAA